MTLDLVLGFPLAPGESAHPLPSDPTLTRVVVVRITAHPPSEDPNVGVVLQIDGDVVIAATGEVSIDLAPYTFNISHEDAADPVRLELLLDRARTGAVDRANTKALALAAAQQFPPTPVPGQSARRV